MGVLTEHVDSKFFLARADEKQALAALKDRVKDSSSPDELVHEPKEVLAAKNFVEALGASAFELKRDAKGNVISLKWAGDKLPYDAESLRVLFTSFAPFVKKGSFLSISEEGEPHTLTFNGKRVTLGDGDDQGDSSSLLEEGDRLAKKKGRVDDALAAYAEAFEIDGHEKDSHGEIALDRICGLLLEHKRWKELAKWALKAPANEQRLVGFADEAGDPKVARTLVEEGLKLSPRDPGCLRWMWEQHCKSEDYKNIVASGRLLREVSKEWKGRTLLAEADALYSLARYEESIAAARQSLKLEPSVSAAARVAEALLALGRESRAAYEAALALQVKENRKSDWGPAHAYEGYLLTRLGRLEEAASAVERGAKLRQDSPVNWVPYMRGFLALAKNDPVAAVKIFEEVLGASPNDDWTKLRLVQALVAARRDPKRVRKLSAELKKKAPDFARELKLESPV